jgi:hypothetical protein
MKPRLVFGVGFWLSAVSYWAVASVNTRALAQEESYETETTETSDDLGSGEQTEAAISSSESDDGNSAPSGDDDPMGFFGLGVKFGFLSFGKADFAGANVTVQSALGETQVVENKGVPARSGMIISVPLNIGGSGFGWALEPYFGLGKIGSYGLYTGPLGSIHVATDFYITLGFGARVGKITTNFNKAKTKMGFDVYGRIPLGMIYYPTDDLGIVAEFGIGYGATGYEPGYTEETIAANNIEKVSVPKVDLQIGDTHQIDFSIGVRIP